MGASDVEVVGNVKNASRKNVSTYDYVVVKDKSIFKSGDANIVSMEWIKQCLICSRLLPISPESM